MSLIDNDLFDGKIDKVQIAIEILKEFEPEEGYYLAFSGGKDSQCIYELAKMSGIKFDAHFHLTSVDSPEIIEFVRSNYPDVELKRPEISMMNLIAQHSMPPTRRVRYCCGELKECGGSGRLVITGIRKAESYKRTQRKLFETCFKDKLKHYLNPIIDWSNEEVWEFIKKRKLTYCDLYNKGFSRIGCIMCPCAGKDRMLRDAIRYPKIFMLWLKSFKKMIESHKEKNLNCDWQTPEEVMEWWIYGKNNNNSFVDPDQTVIFE